MTMKNNRFSNPIQLAAIGCALLLPVMLSAETAPLVGDAHINPGSGLNFGALPTLNLGGASGSQGLLLFDLTHMSGTGTALAWARLRVYVNSVSVAGAVDLSAANAVWAESSVNGTSVSPWAMTGRTHSGTLRTPKPAMARPPWMMRRREG